MQETTLLPVLDLLFICLKCAKENKPCEYNLGVILARSFHLVVRRNATDETPIYAAAIATLVYKYIKDERGYNDNMGTLLEKSTLLDFALISNMGMSVPYGEIHLYTYLSTNGQKVSIRLPCTDLFDRSTGKWIVREEPPQEDAQAPAMQGYQPQEMPQYPSLGSYPYGYYPGGGSGGYGYHLGY